MSSKIVVFLIIPFLTFFNFLEYKIGKKIEMEDLNNTEFIEVLDIEVTKKGIFVSDTKGLKVYKFDNQGNFLKSTGRYGKGPGEYVHGPRFIASSDSTIYVSSHRPFLTTYDENLNFIKNKKFIYSPANIHGIVFSKDELIIAPSRFYEESIIRYNITRENSKSIYLDFELEPGLLSKYAVISMGDNWHILWYFQNRIEVYNSDFERISKFSIQGIPSRSSGEIRKIRLLPKELNAYQAKAYGMGTFIPSGTFFNSFVKLNEDLIIVQLGSQTGGSNKALIINKDGQKMQELILPNKELLLMEYNEGRLFFINRASKKIEVFTLEMN